MIFALKMESFGAGFLVVAFMIGILWIAPIVTLTLSGFVSFVLIIEALRYGLDLSTPYDRAEMVRILGFGACFIFLAIAMLMNRKGAVHDT